MINTPIHKDGNRSMESGLSNVPSYNQRQWQDTRINSGRRSPHNNANRRDDSQQNNSTNDGTAFSRP